MTLSLFHATLLLVLLALAVAVCVSKRRSRAAQKLGVVSAWGAQFVALLVEGPPFVRALDLYRDPERYSLAFRYWFIGTVFDGRKVARVRPQIEWKLLARGGAFLALFCVCFWLIREQRPGGGLAALLIRWLLGAALAYAFVDCAAHFLRAIYAALGVGVGPMHCTPILSRTVQEFWGERWNRPVHELLTRYCFAPFARRRRPRVGVFMAFAGSAGIHFWMTYAAIGVWLALVMGAFFLLHGAIVLVERRMRVARWRGPWGRAWTIGCFTLTTPLFVEPGLRVLEL